VWGIRIVESGVQLGPLITSATKWPIVPAGILMRMDNLVKRWLARENRSSRRKPAPVSTRAARLGSQRLTAWTVTRPKLNSCYIHYMFKHYWTLNLDHMVYLRIVHDAQIKYGYILRV
jgi:hypothetical protein